MNFVNGIWFGLFLALGLLTVFCIGGAIGHKQGLRDGWERASKEYRP